MKKVFMILALTTLLFSGVKVKSNHEIDVVCRLNTIVYTDNTEKTKADGFDNIELPEVVKVALRGDNIIIIDHSKEDDNLISLDVLRVLESKPKDGEKSVEYRSGVKFPKAVVEVQVIIFESGYVMYNVNTFYDEYNDDVVLPFSYMYDCRDEDAYWRKMFQ
jgi:hypothetical protein